ncbi:MAG: ferric reductase-like transmembrane domain-containing protein [Gemmatimonadaceae bacterium]
MTRRMWRRLFRHHVPLAIASVIGTIGIAKLTGLESPRLWSVATAFVSLILLAAAMCIGPLNVVRQRPNPVSTDLRRDLGIWAAITGLVHVVIGLQVHLHDPVKYFLIRAPDGTMSIRHDAFGATNYIGLLATVILAVLLAISSDAALRYLGTQRWKTLQRWTYWLAVLVVLHGILYELIEKRTIPFVLLFGVTTLVVVLIQYRGWQSRHGAKRREAGAESERDVAQSQPDGIA